MFRESYRSQRENKRRWAREKKEKDRIRRKELNRKYREQERADRRYSQERHIQLCDSKRFAKKSRLLQKEREERELAAERKQLEDKINQASNDIINLIQRNDFQGIVNRVNEFGTLEGIYHLLPLPVVLYLAIERNNYSLADDFFKNSKDRNDFPFPVTALSLAVKQGNIRMMDYLWEKCINITRVDKQDGIHPFFHAILANNSSLFRWFVGKEINLTTLCDNNGLTALHYAAYASNYEAIEFLLLLQANVNAVDARGGTPIQYITSGQDSIRCLDLLLKNGATFGLSTYTSLDCLEYMILFAAKNKDYEAAANLLTHFSQGNAVNLLVNAIRDSDVTFFNILMKSHPNVNAISCHGTTPLVEAVGMNCESMVRSLIESGADPELQSEKWEAHLDQKPNPEIRKFLTAKLLQKQLPTYKEKILSENPSCFWNFSNRAPSKRARAVDALSAALESKVDTSLSKFRKQFLVDEELQIMKDKYEKYVKSLDERSKQHTIKQS
ncbi:MAG: ankyrin repeat domain-containing protein [Gammaproteobacteria bacterium]